MGISHSAAAQAIRSAIHNSYYELAINWTTGPIVRITPYEVHIQDPEFYDELYLQRLDKDEWFVAGFDGESTFATGPAELHRLRRSAMNPFFSKASISSRFPVVQQTVRRLCERLEGCTQTGQVVLAKPPFIALTIDVITLFAFGKSYDTLEEPDFGAYWNELFATGVRLSPTARIFPPLRLLFHLPEWVAVRLNPVAGAGITAFVSYISRNSTHRWAELTSSTEVDRDPSRPTAQRE